MNMKIYIQTALLSVLSMGSSVYAMDEDCCFNSEERREESRWDFLLGGNGSKEEAPINAQDRLVWALFWGKRAVVEEAFNAGADLRTIEFPDFIGLTEDDTEDDIEDDVIKNVSPYFVTFSLLIGTCLCCMPEKIMADYSSGMPECIEFLLQKGFSIDVPLLGPDCKFDTNYSNYREFVKLVSASDDSLHESASSKAKMLSDCFQKIAVLIEKYQPGKQA